MSNLARAAGEVAAQSAPGEGDRVGTSGAACRPDRPHPARRADLSRDAGEVCSTLTIATNLDAAPVAFDPPPGRLLFANATLPSGTLPGRCTAAFLDSIR